MSNGNQLERLWKLQTKVNMLVLDGKRDPEKVANIYQAILDGSVVASFNKEPKDTPQDVPEIPATFSFAVYCALGMEAEYDAYVSEHGVPEEKEDLWTLLMLPGLTCGKLIKLLKKRKVKVWQYVQNLDADVTENDRDPSRDGAYIIRFKQNIEADPEHQNKSAEMCKKEGLKSITLLERIFLECAYFLEIGNHLDQGNWTLCDGSRRSGGRVPRVRWLPGDRWVCVLWCRPADRGPHLRSRVAVS